MTTRFKLTWSSLGVIVLLGIALALRLKGLTATSLSVDECTMVQNAQGILTSGYPCRNMGNFSFPLSTYEFLPYPLALILAFFGTEMFFLRLPAVLFGVATTGMIYLIGTRWFNRATGFVAALIYAFAPWALNWSQCLFHPSQDQFLGLLTIYFFYRGAFESSELQDRYLYISVATFSLAYLTWEGYGVLLPVFLLAMFVFRWDDWQWMKSPTLWSVALLASVVVILELCWRLISLPPFLLIGQELRHLRTPTLAFLLPDTDFWVSWREFFWGENRAVLTFIALAGLPLIRRDRPLAYLYLVIVPFPICLTFFLESSLPHYFYGMFPGLILIAARTLTCYLGRISDLLPSREAISDRVLKSSLILVALVGVFLTCNGMALQLYHLNYPSEPEPFYDRRNFMWIDHRGGTQFVTQQTCVAPLVSNMGAELQLSEGITGNYAVEFFPLVPVIYDNVSKGHFYREKYIGAQSLRNSHELEDAFSRHRKLYLGIDATHRWDIYIPELMDILTTHCQPVYHGIEMQVFLWNR
jgi:4-amino-4-deoxy-L-arabinose transferase-like glycosyltransferase